MIVFPLSTIVDNLICSLIVNKKFPYYKAEGILEREEIKRVFKDTGGAFCSKIGSTVYLSVDNVVISSFLGLYILGVYNNYYYVITVFTMLYAVAHNSLRPVIGNYWAVESGNNNWEKFKMINTCYMLVTIYVCALSITLLQKFEIIWGGSENFLSFDIVVLMVVCFYISRMTAIPTVYLEASGTLWQGKFVPLISAFFNLILNLFLVQIIGLPGIIVSSIVAALVINIPGYIIVLNKNVFKNYGYLKYYLESNVKYGLQFWGLSFVCLKINYYMFNENNFFTFIIEGLFLTCVAILILIVLNIKNSDMKLLIDYLKKYIKKFQSKV